MAKMNWAKARHITSSRAAHRSLRKNKKKGSRSWYVTEERALQLMPTLLTSRQLATELGITLQQLQDVRTANGIEPEMVFNRNTSRVFGLYTVSQKALLQLHVVAGTNSTAEESKGQQSTIAKINSNTGEAGAIAVALGLRVNQGIQGSLMGGTAPSQNIDEIRGNSVQETASEDARLGLAYKVETKGHSLQERSCISCSSCADTAVSD